MSKQLFRLVPVLFFLLVSGCVQRTPKPPSLPVSGDSGESPGKGSAFVGVLGFFWGDDYGKLFVRISRANWQLPETGLENPRLLQGSGPSVVLRELPDDGTLAGVELDIYQGHEVICRKPVGNRQVVSRVIPHFGSLEDLGLYSETGEKRLPKFPAILELASHVLGMVLDECGNWVSGQRDIFHWARPASLPPPAFWLPLDEGDPLFTQWKQVVDRHWTEHPFGEKSSEYLKKFPEDPPVVRTRIFSRESRALIEDHRKVGETMCGGEGHEVWSLWQVSEGGIPRMLVSSETTRRILLVADLDQDGWPEMVIQEGLLGNSRTLFRLKDGKLQKILEDWYPFNDCPC